MRVCVVCVRVCVMCVCGDITVSSKLGLEQCGTRVGQWRGIGQSLEV